MADAETPADPASLIAALTALLDVEQIDIDLYRGPQKPDGIGRVYGGQVIAQALVAATHATPPERVVHSLHAYFMRPGDEDQPIIYRVKRDHDGGSFSTRRVIAFQRGQPILSLAASFQKRESGLAHQAEMPAVPAPEDLPDEMELRRAFAPRVPEKWRPFFLRPRPFEMRPVGSHGWMTGETEPPAQQIWLRAAAPVGDDPALHRAMLAYMSDMFLLGTAMRPHGVSWLDADMQTASLDHALWLHEDFRVDDWLLYTTDSPWAGGGRGFNRGALFTRDGRLIASAAQEGLIRQRG
ncbi:acyl-CoA thioesterase [Sphingomonas flavalba]|uniref:acyl-CoA thioesterase n=1 Tax=Sphingomonas flavalba TaxID=2559804 RepID=UPI00109D9C38|nr:acyl-CoA thioesterase II [Sphingomonas flavalba]